MRPRAFATLGLLVFVSLAGCVQDDELQVVEADGYDTSRGWSQPLSPPLHGVLPGERVDVPSFDGTPMALGVFRPAMEGCDWGGGELPDMCRLPVVLSASPYWGPGVGEAGVRPPLVEWLVPRGYAVVQMSLRGTGESGGCMEFGSLAEQRDVDEVLTWLGGQAWSTGSIGMTGRSYVGTTPWYGAAFGNPHLKTIVPISGITDWRELMFKNGTSETRGPFLHAYFSWAYGMGLQDGGDPDHRMDHWVDQVDCDETAKGAVEGPLTKALADAGSPYWDERAMRGRILENYEGSVWVIHGLHDWNVNPSQSVPFLHDLQDKGLDVKAWLGVWGHHYPDRRDEHPSPRWDWADTMVRWFDRHLRGLDVDTGPAVEVQDHLMVWRAEESYPPRDAAWTTLELSAGGRITLAGDAEAGEVVLAGSPTAAAFRATWNTYLIPDAVPVPPVRPPTSDVQFDAGDATTRAVFTSDAFEAPLRIAGHFRLPVTVTPTTPVGGSLFAELHDVWPDGRTQRIGWAGIDVRNHAGGNTEPATLVPGQPVVAHMESEPLDALVAEGHRLRVVLHKNGVETVDPSPTADPLLVGLGDGRSLLRLQMVERATVVPSHVPPGLG